MAKVETVLQILDTIVTYLLGLAQKIHQLSLGQDL